MCWWVSQSEVLVSSELPLKKQRLERETVAYTGPVGKDTFLMETIDAFKQIKEGLTRVETEVRSAHVWEVNHCAPHHGLDLYRPSSGRSEAHLYLANPVA